MGEREPQMWRFTCGVKLTTLPTNRTCNGSRAPHCNASRAPHSTSWSASCALLPVRCAGGVGASLASMLQYRWC